MQQPTFGAADVGCCAAETTKIEAPDGATFCEEE